MASGMTGRARTCERVAPGQRCTRLVRTAPASSGTAWAEWTDVYTVLAGKARRISSTHFSEPAIPVSHSWTIATRSWLGASSSASVGDGAPATAPST